MVSILRSAYFAPPALEDTSSDLTLDFRHSLVVPDHVDADISDIPIPEPGYQLSFDQPYPIDDQHMLFTVRRDMEGRTTFKLALFDIIDQHTIRFSRLCDTPPVLDTTEVFFSGDHLCGQWRPIVCNLKDMVPIDLTPCLLDQASTGRTFVGVDHVFKGDTCGILYELFGDTFYAWYDQVIMSKGERISHERIGGSFDHRTLVLDGADIIRGLSRERDSLMTWRSQAWH